jgi:hypothetical protein
MARLDYTSKPTYWRMQAEAMRGIAASMDLAEGKARLEHIADEYDALASDLDAALRGLLDMAVGDNANVRPFRPQV